MRVYIRKTALLICGALVTTIILLMMPTNIERTATDQDYSVLDSYGNSNAALPRALNYRQFRRKKLDYSQQQQSNSKNVEGADRGWDKTPWPQVAVNDLRAANDDALYAKYGPPARANSDQELISNLRRYLNLIGEEQVQKMLSQECPLNETLTEYWKRTRRREVPARDAWEQYYAEIGTCEMYRNEKTISNLLHDISTLPIKHVATMDGGTQVKLIITFENEKQAVLKPMRFGRQYETDPNHFYFGDFERHTAEIATFHLDKVLGFRRAIPTVGRVMNITSELQNNAEKKLKKTFFVSPAKNHCFVSKCDYYCDTTHAICGSPDLKEGSLQVFLPDQDVVPRDHNRSPFRRTYSKRNQLADWQKDMTYCLQKVKTRSTYAHGRRLLDLVDLHILDFLIGNQDRHHFDSFTVFDDLVSYPIHLDNGRAFGRPKEDDMDILLPLAQCCTIRPSTLLTLLRFYSGPESLSEALYRSMKADPVSPILAPKHYPALERRVEKILYTVNSCLKAANSPNDVIMTNYEDPTVPYVEEDADPESEENKNRPHTTITVPR